MAVAERTENRALMHTGHGDYLLTGTQMYCIFGQHRVHDNADLSLAKFHYL